MYSEVINRRHPSEKITVSETMCLSICFELPSTYKELTQMSIAEQGLIPGGPVITSTSDCQEKEISMAWLHNTTSQRRSCKVPWRADAVSTSEEKLGSSRRRPPSPSYSPSPQTLTGRNYGKLHNCSTTYATPSPCPPHPPPRV